MQFLKGKVRKGGDIVQVVNSEDPLQYSVKVYIEVAYDYIDKGYDPQDYLKVSVAERNFEKGRKEEKSRFE